ncbi:MAG: hypothetical protein U0Z17_09170 [Bacteroidales bacterium]
MKPSICEAAVCYNAEAINSGYEIISFSRRFSRLADELAKPTPISSRLKKLTEQLKEASEKYFKDYNMPTDVKMLAAMLELYYNDVPQEHAACIPGQNEPEI